MTDPIRLPASRNGQPPPAGDPTGSVTVDLLLAQAAAYERDAAVHARAAHRLRRTAAAHRRAAHHLADATTPTGEPTP